MADQEQPTSPDQVINDLNTVDLADVTSADVEPGAESGPANPIDNLPVGDLAAGGFRSLSVFVAKRVEHMQPGMGRIWIAEQEECEMFGVYAERWLQQVFSMKDLSPGWGLVATVAV